MGLYINTTGKPGTSRGKNRLINAARALRNRGQGGTTTDSAPEPQEAKYFGWMPPNSAGKSRRRPFFSKADLCGDNVKGRPEWTAFARDCIEKLELTQEEAGQLLIEVADLGEMGLTVSQIYRTYSDNQGLLQMVSVGGQLWAHCTHCEGRNGKTKWDYNARRWDPQGKITRINGRVICRECNNFQIPGEAHHGVMLPAHFNAEGLVLMHQQWMEGVLTIIELGFQLKDEVTKALEGESEYAEKTLLELGLRTQDSVDSIVHEAYKVADAACFAMGYRVPNDGGDRYDAVDRFGRKVLPVFTDTLRGLWNDFWVQLTSSYPETIGALVDARVEERTANHEEDRRTGRRVRLIPEDAGRNTIEIAINQASNINVQPDVEDGLSVTERGSQVIITGPASEVNEALIEYLGKGYIVKAAHDGEVTLVKA